MKKITAVCFLVKIHYAIAEVKKLEKKYVNRKKITAVCFLVKIYYAIAEIEKGVSLKRLKVISFKRLKYRNEKN